MFLPFRKGRKSGYFIQRINDHGLVSTYSRTSARFDDHTIFFTQRRTNKKKETWSQVEIVILYFVLIVSVELSHNGVVFCTEVLMFGTLAKLKSRIVQILWSIWYVNLICLFELTHTHFSPDYCHLPDIFVHLKLWIKSVSVDLTSIIIDNLVRVI